jgi:hypothetical protein
MTAQRLHAAALATAFLLVAAPAAMAQTTGGAGGGVTGRKVTASTYGAGAITQNGAAVSGRGKAETVDDSSSTGAGARINDRPSILRTEAQAQTEDERARSRPRVDVDSNQGTIGSTTTSQSRERGAPPVRETIRPEGGATQTKSKGPK